MKGVPNIRHICGIISAILVLVFCAHALLGGISLLIPLPRRLAFFIWVGVCLLAAHVAVCMMTSWHMMTDIIRPPSSKKKKHLVVKWTSGTLLLVCATIHIWRVESLASFDNDRLFLFTTLFVIIFLAYHLCVGAKSLLKDLEIDRNRRRELRIVVCSFSMIVAATIIEKILGA